MQVGNQARQINSANLGEQAAFSIAQNSHAFSILSDGLYSDKVTAVLRELSTNAIDSHKAIKSTEPFEIKLPNIIDPTFYVKDFGLGLSHDQVMNLFSTYFQSNKSHDNEMTGGFGLGSKSPFSYTDSFSVVSRFDGEKTTYNAYIGENGCPQIVVMCSEPTEEHNGVEISFTVKRLDFTEFADKLSKVVTYFDIKPVVKGNDRYKPEVIEYTQRGEKWGLRKSERYSGSHGAKVIMGGVAYYIDSTNFGEGKSELYDCLINSPIDIFLNIGDVAINPSREALNYRKQDIEKLSQIFDIVISDISKIIEERVMKHTTIWGAVSELDKIYNEAYDLRQIISLSKFNINGEEIKYRWSKHVKLPENIEVSYFDNGTKRRGSLARPGTELLVRPASNTVIIYNDLPRGGIGRMKYYREQNYQMNGEFIQPVIDPKKPKSITSVKKLSKMFFDAPIILASTLEVAPRKDGLIGRGVGYSVKVSMLKNGQIFTRGNEDPIRVTKTTLKDTIDTYIETNTDIIIVRMDNNVKAKFPEYLDKPFDNGVKTRDLLAAIYQLNDVLVFNPSAFIFVKNDGNVHNMIKTMAPNAQTLEDWAKTKFVSVVTNDIATNKNSMFVKYTDNSQINAFSYDTKNVFSFVSLYGMQRKHNAVKTNKLLDNMYESVKHVIETTDSSAKSYNYKSEACSVIQHLINSKLITYKHQSKINDFNALAPKLLQYPLVKNIIQLSGGNCYVGYSSTSGSKSEIMNNCVDYINQMDTVI